MYSFSGASIIRMWPSSLTKKLLSISKTIEVKESPLLSPKTLEVGRADRIRPDGVFLAAEHGDVYT